MKWSLLGIIIGAALLIWMGWADGAATFFQGLGNTFGIVVFAVMVYCAYLMWKSWREYRKKP
jgi:hypothetical protein